MQRHELTRIRRDPKRRWLQVAAVEPLSSRMRRIRFTSPALADFESAAPDDHIKLFFPEAAGTDDGKPCMRDFTPRAFDPKTGTLTIDFALHEAGPATSWAAAAEVGQILEIAGPRGSTVVPDDFDWYLLIGDETALPAIGRRVEQLRPGVPVTTVVVVEDSAEIQTFETPADWSAIWVFRDANGVDDAARLRQALAGVELPPGDGFLWIAAEAAAARDLRAYMLEIRGHPRFWARAAGYWKRGEAGAEKVLED
jgi:NADPH-dependent ferric siderophore reductase